MTEWPVVPDGGSTTMTEQHDTAHTGSPTIRRATPDDGPAVRTFVFATLRSYGIEPDPEGLDADVMAFGTHGDGPIDEFVAEVDGEVVGSVAVSPTEDRNGHLSRFFVDCAFRGRGLGRLLLTRVVEDARRRGYRRIELETRTAFQEAVHLYETTGWRRGPDLPPGYGPDRTYTLDLDGGRAPGFR
jgi:putative acetyltransferase